MCQRRFITLAIRFYLFGFTASWVFGETEEEAQKWLDELEPNYSKICNQFQLADWNAATNITEETVKVQIETSSNVDMYNTNLQKQVLEKFPNWKEFKNKTLRKGMKSLASEGSGNMSMDRVIQFKQLTSEFVSAFGQATVCRYNDSSDCNATLEEIENIIKLSSDARERIYYFNAWHDKMSSLITPSKYSKFVDLLQERAQANGFKNAAEHVMYAYHDETDDWTFEKFKKQLLVLAQEIAKLYDIYHAYVRMKLRKNPDFHGLIEECGYIPVHVTGNMYGENWESLDKITKPFPDAPSLDATQPMLDKGYTVRTMYEEADKFFQNLGLLKMTKEVWEKSILERPNDDRKMVCHPHSYDMCKGKGSTDFRIKYCTEVNRQGLHWAHHEMGHIQYFQQYTNLSFVYRYGANLAFHEAIGDALALSVTTPKHLQCVLNLDLGFPESLCDRNTDRFNVTETDINYLFLMASQKLTVIPLKMVTVIFRYQVFEGIIKKEDYNNMWWNIRNGVQGVSFPTNRSDSNLFDPAAILNVAANVEQLSKFFAGILQFQLYEALCITAGEFDPYNKNSKPLYQCDFSGSKEAGTKFANMMKLGSSVGWPDALEMVTGTRELSVESIRNFFQPLLQHLEKELKENEESIGFGHSCDEVEKRARRSPLEDIIVI